MDTLGYKIMTIFEEIHCLWCRVEIVKDKDGIKIGNRITKIDISRSIRDENSILTFTFDFRAFPL